MNNKFKITLISLVVFFILGVTEGSRAEEEIKFRPEERLTETKKQPEKDFAQLGEVKGEVFMAKYISSEPHFNWNSRVGIDIDILRYKKTFFYFNGYLESVLESDGGTDFDPYDLNYMVEPGVRWEHRMGSLSSFLRHICQHDVDRFDGTTEKYNIWGIRLESKEKDSFENGEGFEWLGNFNELFSLGKYAHRTDNNYNWDVIAEVGVDILRYKKIVTYLTANTHLVTQTADRPSGRKYFLDYTFEPGVKFRTSKGVLDIFCQICHKHDINRWNGTTDDFGLLGIRYKW